MAKTNIHMLTVDDQSLISNLERAGYRSVGLKVSYASSLEEVHRILKKTNITIIHINAQMAAVPLQSLLQELKNHFSDVPIILTTVENKPELLDLEKNGTIQLILQIPQSKEQFIEAIKNLLKHTTRQEQRHNFKGIFGKIRVTTPKKTKVYDIGDLSLAGVFVRSQKALEINSDVELVLSASGKSIAINGVVARWVFEKHFVGFGIRFVNLSAENKSNLEEFLSHFPEHPRMVYYL